MPIWGRLLLAFMVSNVLISVANLLLSLLNLSGKTANMGRLRAWYFRMADRHDLAFIITVDLCIWIPCFILVTFL